MEAQLQEAHVFQPQLQMMAGGFFHVPSLYYGKQPSGKKRRGFCVKHKATANVEI
jgi:hypothetical protein